MAIMRSDKTVLDLLNELIELEYEAIEAYEAAVGRVAESRDRARIEGFLEDHVRQVSELCALVRQLGGEPAGASDLKQMLKRGKVVIVALFGDRKVLEAMKVNEAESERLHARIAARPHLPQPVRTVMRRHLATEHRHHTWIVDRLDARASQLRL
ncbi:DUF2383 domain-containing protein [Chondromyces apiculatus]|uniref:DUF2383 domain-containing protein n=1 Tax=Chondromyces apiculatus DSM 436 TaxID=1192034 RepID=A0A017SW94_9BACT|nr:DUF2383 domain-containing protein [Chondromyces apiculatus]EYF01244.1 Hypothetical protein CAP_8497 [Chondromyces apiculatus DSM 436]